MFQWRAWASRRPWLQSWRRSPTVRTWTGAGLPDPGHRMPLVSTAPYLLSASVAGSRIRCFFSFKDPDQRYVFPDFGSWISDPGLGSWISDPGSRIPDLGSRIPNPYFWELSNIFFGSTIILCQFAQIFCVIVQKYNNFQLFLHRNNFIKWYCILKSIRYLLFLSMSFIEYFSKY